jgi:hypothetical protein
MAHEIGCGGWIAAAEKTLQIFTLKWLKWLVMVVLLLVLLLLL